MNTLKALALATVPVLGLLVALLLIQVSSAVERTSRDETQIALGVETVLDTVNRPCSTPGKIQPCGTLAEVDKTLAHISDLSIQSQAAVRNADLVTRGEMKLLPAWNASLTHTLANVDVMTATVNHSAEELTNAAVPVIGQARVVLGSADLAVQQFTVTEQHLDTLIESPDVTESLKHVAETTKSIADGTAQADAILADGRKVADKYANPPPKKWYVKVWDVVKTGGELTWDFLR